MRSDCTVKRQVIKMKIVIAPDSFKGSLTARQVAAAIQTGLKWAFPTANYEIISMAAYDFPGRFNLAVAGRPLAEKITSALWSEYIFSLRPDFGSFSLAIGS